MQLPRESVHSGKVLPPTCVPGDLFVRTTDGQLFSCPESVSWKALTLAQPAVSASPKPSISSDGQILVFILVWLIVISLFVIRYGRSIWKQ